MRMHTSHGAGHQASGGLLSGLGRLLRHLWMDADDTRRAIPPALSEALTARIASSEGRHGGEVRLCVEASLPWSELRRIGRQASVEEVVRQRAWSQFGRLGVWDTERNTGVLVYVLLAEHAIEIVADRGLRAITPEQWQRVADELAQAFRGRQGGPGLLRALDRVEALLVAAGVAVDAVNELPDAPHLQ